MPSPVEPAIQWIQERIRELDETLKKGLQDLNAVRATENIRKWKQRTAHLMAEHVSPQDAQRFSAKGPGPSFASDLQEEMTDEAEVYRTFLLSLIEELKKHGGTGQQTG